jgi:hypothetical protein
MLDELTPVGCRAALPHFLSKQAVIVRFAAQGVFDDPA